MALNRSNPGAITFTAGATMPASLVNVYSSSSTTVSTSSNVVDHEVVVTAGVGAITAGSATQVNVYVYGSANGLTWPGGASGAEIVSGTDQAITWSANGNQAIFLGVIMCHTPSITIASKPFSIAAAFAGSMPAKYVIVLQNQSTLALTSVTVAAQEIYYT